MLNMKNFFIVVITVFTISLLSCSEPNQSTNTENSKPAFIGEWYLNKMDLGGEIIKANILGNPSYVFNLDHTYVIHASAQIEQGTWKLNKKQLILFSKDLNKETILNIKDVSEKEFVYEIGDETISVVYLKR